MYITEERLLRKNNNFDAIRLAAALFVFISHAYAIMDLGKFDPLGLITGRRYVFSYLGLAIFFSMSGFLVCRSLVISGSIKQFLINRFLRIWPAYAICIVFCILFVGFPLTSLPVLQFISHPETASYFLINISLLSSTMHLPDVLNGKAVNPSIWTIPVEVRLYLLLLLIYLVAKLSFRQWLLLFTIAIWCAPIFIPESLQHALFKQHVLGAIHLGNYFLMGACFYLYKDRIALKFYIWLLLLVYWLSLHIWFGPDRLGLISTAQHPFLVYSFIWIAFRWPRLPFIKADISYGIYLFGGPVQVLAKYTIGQQVNFVVFFLITGLCTVILAILSWHLIEKRALSLKHIFTRKQASTTAP